MAIDAKIVITEQLKRQRKCWTEVMIEAGVLPRLAEIMYDIAFSHGAAAEALDLEGLVKGQELRFKGWKEGVSEIEKLELEALEKGVFEALEKGEFEVIPRKATRRKTGRKRRSRNG